MVEPILESPDRLHSIFELRERHDHSLLDDRLSVHVLQLSGTLRPNPNVHEAKIQRWARFFRAREDIEFEQLASEDPIMATAVHTLDQISQDPEIEFELRRRADAQWFDRLNLRLSVAQGVERGIKQGKAELVLKLLGNRFGPLTMGTEIRVRHASSEQLDAWADRMLTAKTLDDVLTA